MGYKKQEWNEITTAELKDAVRKTQKWKSPGIDKVPNFLLNAFDSIHDSFTNCLNKAMNNPELNPKWFTQRVTYILANSNDTNIPKNYLPITSLPTMY